MLNPKRVVYAKQKQPKPLLKKRSYRCLLTQINRILVDTTFYITDMHGPQSKNPHQTFSHSRVTTDMHGLP
jgi:hypothetical protein